MYKVLRKQTLAPEIVLMEVEAPLVASSAKPGQFVIVRAYTKGERIPLTIADYDAKKGSVTIVIQALGASTRLICTLNEGDSLQDFAGPLGQPSEFVSMTDEELLKKRILFVAGGVGAAPIYPQVKYLFDRGVLADVILGARSAEMVILEDQLRAVAGRLIIATNDGSRGRKGVVTEVMGEMAETGSSWDCVVTIGPMIMMKYVSVLTRKLGVKTIASLNSMMIDGTGMCGACRVSVGGKTMFTCVDGPEFDAHKVNFDEAMRRLNMYKSHESQKMAEYVKKDHKCRIGRTV